METLSRPRQRDQSPAPPRRPPPSSETESAASSPEHSRAPRPLHSRNPHRTEKARDSTRRGRSITRSPTAGTAGASNRQGQDYEVGEDPLGGLHSRRPRKERRRSRSPSRSRSGTADEEDEDEEKSEDQVQERDEGHDARMEDVQRSIGQRKTKLGGVSEGGRRRRSRQRQRYRRRSDYAYEAERKGAVEGARGMLKNMGRLHEDEAAMDSDEEPEGRWEGVIVEDKHGHDAGDGVGPDAAGEWRRQKRLQQRGGLRDSGPVGQTQDDEAGVKFKGRGSMKYREGGKRR